MCEGQRTVDRSQTSPASLLLLKRRPSRFSAHTFTHWATQSSFSPVLSNTVTQPGLISASSAYIWHALLFLGIRWYGHVITSHLPSTAEHSDSHNTHATATPHSCTQSHLRKEKKCVLVVCSRYSLILPNAFDLWLQRKSLKIKANRGHLKTHIYNITDIYIHI